MAAQIKSVQDARVGDTITRVKHPAEQALPGYVVRFLALMSSCRP
jgi:GTP-binding protein LepA